jgi:type II secretion system protein I
MPTNCLKTRNPDRGFTLVELMVALAIVAVTAVVVLKNVGEVVRDAGKASDLKTTWWLTAEKMAELELDPEIWTGTGGSWSGDFSEIDEAYGGYQWECEVNRETVTLSDPTDPEEYIREIFRLRLSVWGPSVGAEEEPFRLEALFPAPQEETP